MVEIWIPYGNTQVPMSIEIENLAAEVKPRNIRADDSEIASESKFENRKDLKKLCESVDQNDKVTICIENFSPLLFSLIPIIKEIGNSGIKQSNVSILLSNNPNHKTSMDKSINLLLKEHDLGHINVLSHDLDSSELTEVGSTSYGNKIHLNKKIIDSSFKICISHVRPHFMSGYSGVETLILPGLSSMESALFNATLSLHSDSRPGKLKGNPAYEDAREAMDLAKVDYVVNLILDTKMNLFEAFLGKPNEVLRKGTKFIENLYKIEIEKSTEVIVTSPGGNLFDNNLYDACDSLYNIYEVIKKDSVLILVSECMEGYGNSAFYDYMQKAKNIKNSDLIKKAKKNFKIGYEKAHFLSELNQRAKIILVSVMPDYYTRNVFGFKSAESANDALKMAKRSIGGNYKGLIIPYGNLTIPKINK
ncbi:lactate racemase domain-containing protein [[Eubacterium] cellulosolvens]